jgi:hypothetical protein
MIDVDVGTESFGAPDAVLGGSHPLPGQTVRSKSVPDDIGSSPSGAVPGKRRARQRTGKQSRKKK